nr:MAG TPA: hypothetical protein [Caudoviricetes sp.]
MSVNSCSFAFAFSLSPSFNSFKISFNDVKINLT